MHDVVHNASVNFENDFVCKILNKSEPSCLLEMVLSIITGGVLLGGVPGPGGGLCSSWGGAPRTDGYCCGRYASHWNAFLLIL